MSMQIEIHSADARFEMGRKENFNDTTLMNPNFISKDNAFMSWVCRLCNKLNLINYNGADFVLECAWLTSCLKIMLIAYFSLLHSIILCFSDLD